MIRNRRRRDSGTARALLEELQESLDEIGIHVDAVLDEWLVPAADGKHSVFSDTSTRQEMLTQAQNPIRPNWNKSV